MVCDIRKYKDLCRKTASFMNKKTSWSHNYRINPKPLQSAFFWSPVWFQVKNVTIQVFFSILAPQTRLLWIGFKTTLKRTTVRIFQIKSQNIFFCLSRQPFFVNESLCCCCCAKVSPMYLYIEIGVPLVYYAFQLALPEGQNFQTFPLLDQWNQIQREWDRPLIYEKKKNEWNGII